MGSITANGVPVVSGIPLNIGCGTNLVITAKTNGCHIFDNWELNGNPAGTSLSYTIPNVTGPHNLVANFSPKSLDVTVSEEPPGSGYACCPVQGIICNTPHTVTAFETNPMYKFSHWSEGSAIHPIYRDNPHTFAVDKDYDLVANFKVRTFDVYLNVSPPPGGWTEGGGNHIPYGADTTVRAHANTDYNFLNWTDQHNTVLSWDSVFSFKVFSDTVLTANFALKVHNIKVWSVDPSGGTSGGTVEGDLDHIPHGTLHTIKAQANENYHFARWTVNGIYGDTIHQAGAVFTFPVTQSEDWYAHFEFDSYQVTFAASPPHGGIVPKDTAVIWGTVLPMETAPNQFFYFDKWLKNGSDFSIRPATSHTITENCHFVAVFTCDTFDVSVEAFPPEGGTVWSNYTTAIPYLTPVTITAEPDTCHSFLYWTEADTVVATNPVYTFEIEGNRAFTAVFEVTKFLIAASANTGGSVDFKTAYIDCGTDTTLTAIPEVGYRFVNWTENNEEFSTDNPLTIHVTEPHDLVANFEYVAYNIKLLKEPFEGGQVDSAAIYPLNYDLTVHAKPNPGFKFVSWTDEDTVLVSLNADYQFFVSKDEKLTANFTTDTLDVILWAEPENCGDVEGGGMGIPYDELTTIKAIPKPNFVFRNWTEENGAVFSTKDSLTFRVLRSLNLTANFKPKPYLVTVSANPKPGGEVTGGGTFDFGSIDTVRAYPNLEYDYVFDNWTDLDSGKVVSPEPVYFFTVRRDYNLVANFIPKYCNINVSADPTEGGKVEGNISNIVAGETWTVRAEPYDKYLFVMWSENGDSVYNEPEYPFIVKKDRNLTAHFEKKVITIAVSANPPHAADTLTGAGNYDYGDTISVAATPNEQYSFIDWTINGESVSDENPYPFLTTESCELTANFNPILFNITLIADPPEFGEVSGGGELLYLTDCHALATPKEGYHFLYWTEDSLVLSTEEEVIFKVEEARTLIAHFEKTIYTVTVEVNDTLFGNATGGGEYMPNEIATLQAFAKQGSHFLNWTIGNSVVSTENVYERLVTESITIVANFYGLDFDTYAATLWDNTFMLNLNKLEEEGYDIIGCKWFKNGMELEETNTIDQFSYSAGSKSKDRLELAPTYYSFQLTTKDSTILYSSKKFLHNYTPNPAPPNEPLLVYPNPAFSGTAFTVEGLTKDTYIEVYNPYGVCLSRTVATDEMVTLSLNLPSGIYFIRNNHKEAKVVITR